MLAAYTKCYTLFTTASAFWFMHIFKNPRPAREG